MQKVFDYLSECEQFFFCTVDGDCPRSRPFGFKMMFEGKLYVGLGDQKAAYAELLKNPNVEIVASKTKGNFIRIRGKAVIDKRDEVQEAMFAASPFLKKVYNPETGNRHECLYLEDMSAIVFTNAGRTQEKLY